MFTETATITLFHGKHEYHQPMIRYHFYYSIFFPQHLVFLVFQCLFRQQQPPLGHLCTILIVTLFLETFHFMECNSEVQTTLDPRNSEACNVVPIVVD
jgi:hypothetical protein